MPEEFISGLFGVGDATTQDSGEYWLKTATFYFCVVF